MCKIEIQIYTKKIKIQKGVFNDEKNLSAEEKAENERARLQKENEHQERQERSQEKKSKRKKEAHRLIPAVSCFREILC